MFEMLSNLGNIYFGSTPFLPSFRPASVSARGSSINCVHLITWPTSHTNINASYLLGHTNPKKVVTA